MLIIFRDLFQSTNLNAVSTSCRVLKGTVMQIAKALINDRLRDSKVFIKFRIPTIYNFPVIYP